MTIFYTADSHFFHKNIIRYCNRPVEIDQHDDWLIKRWNEVVGEDDLVYHLGDFAFGNRKRSEEIIHRLNGFIYLIPGNHDKKRDLPSDITDKFEVLSQYYEIKIPDEEMDIDQRIILCHYPIESWNHRHHGSWHLHGHCHGTLPSGDHQARLDVGVDARNYRPISYNEIKTIMTRKVFKPVDHHK